MPHIADAFTVYSDGGSRGNPGPAAYGYIIYSSEGTVLAEKGEYIGITTNNQAEYQGIVAALDALVEQNIRGPVTCYLDSQLVVRQINGQYRMKHPDLKPWLARVQERVRELGGHVRFVDVRREDNREADRLVNVTLDNAALEKNHGNETAFTPNT